MRIAESRNVPRNFPPSVRSWRDSPAWSMRESRRAGAVAASFSRNAERLVERHPRRLQALDAHRVQLLEALELPRLASRSAGWRTSRAGTSLPPAPVTWISESCSGGQPLAALELRDHLVAAPLDAEAVDVVPAQEGREVPPDPAQVDSLRAQLVAVEDHLGLGLVELEVGVREEEEPAGEGLPHQRVRDLDQPLRLRGGRDHEVHREVARRPAAASASSGSRASPGIFASGAEVSTSSCSVVFVRSLQGFVTMPPKPPVGPVIWNVLLGLGERAGRPR